MIRMQALVHLLSAVGLYARQPVLPIAYQIGMPISIVPIPFGDIVVYGVNLTLRVFDEVVFPSTLELDVIETLFFGRTSCRIVIPGIEVVLRPNQQNWSEQPRILTDLRIYDEKGVWKFVIFNLMDYKVLEASDTDLNTILIVSGFKTLQLPTSTPSVSDVQTGGDDAKNVLQICGSEQGEPTKNWKH